MPTYTFCRTCGSLKETQKICKACINIVRTEEKSARIAKEQTRFIESRKIKDAYYKQVKKNKPKKSKRFSIRYSDSLGIEWVFEPDDEFKTKTKVNFCIKCKKNKLHYAGWWVRAGGQYAPSESTKRIFLCSDCWRPKGQR